MWQKVRAKDSPFAWKTDLPLRRLIRQAYMSSGMIEETGLWVERGGNGAPTLVLLHGLGANAAVWAGLRPVVEAKWPARWMMLDLPGHGRSCQRAPYGYAAYAAAVAGLLGQDEEVVLLGHSMGGVVAMVLATGWFGIRVRQVLAFGVKLDWMDEEVAKLREIGRAPVRWFKTREEAQERYLRVSGLKDLVDPDSACAARGIIESEGKFRLSVDPAANLAVGPPVDSIIRVMNAPLRLAAGERDPAVSAEQMRRYDPHAVLLEGLGHNPHVESPDRLWQLMESLPITP